MKEAEEMEEEKECFDSSTKAWQHELLLLILVYGFFDAVLLFGFDLRR